MLKLELLNMAFGLVHSSVERSTSRHGHLRASARLLYRLALVLVFGLIVWKWVNIPWTQTRNVVLALEICLVANPLFGVLKKTWKPQKF